MLLSQIDSANHIVLIVHKNPDADSLGAACAFYSHLLRGQKKATLFCASTLLDPNLGFLPWFDKVTGRFPKNADLMISFDCGNRERLGTDADLPLINIDHHRSNDLFGTLNLVNTDAISTTEVLYDFFIANDIKINGKMALSLYAGLLDDSKCFSSAACTSRIFAVAHDLMLLGADHSVCVEWMYQRRSLASLRLRGILLKEMQLRASGALALFEVKGHHLEQSGATLYECKQVLEEALDLATVRAALMQIEHPQGGVKISLRTDGTLDASNVLSLFGGGGHANRAGMRIDRYDTAVLEEIIQRIEKEFE